MCLTLVSACCFFSYSNAQDVQTTNNLVNPTGWQGCLTQHNGWIWAGTTGGPCPVQRSGDGAILFSYGSGLLYQTIAINQALLGTGIQVRGYEYGWTIKNANAGGNQAITYDPLSITVRLYDNTNKNIVENKSYDYSRRINDWTRFTGTENFANPYSLSSLGNFEISMSGRDAGNWAGYYGAEINNIDVRLRYSVDPCGANPLSSPTCEGYQQAFLQQQCAINPLYSQSCPGWQQAWFNQQCSANPLFGPNCPGYAAAYQAQQCSLNPLFNPGCPEYETAYFNQQCAANPLYNNKCPGYETAYFNNQCSLNPLFNNKCAGYEQAFFGQQCAINPLYNVQCPGYQQAYFNQQCTANPLYNVTCPGYQQAFFSQQCSLNTLYDSGCPGYAEAYRAKLFTNSCQANPQSSPQCPGYRATTVSNTTQSTNLADAADPVKSITENPLVADPVTNAILTTTVSKTDGTGPVNVVNPPSALGQGLQVPGLMPGVQLSPPPRASRSTTTQSARTAAAQQAIQQARTLSAEQQKEEATMAAMATVPGFDAYQNAVIPDTRFYIQEQIYRRANLPDNQRAQRALSQRSDRLHQQMVDQQYNLVGPAR